MGDGEAAGNGPGFDHLGRLPFDKVQIGDRVTIEPTEEGRMHFHGRTQTDVVTSIDRHKDKIYLRGHGSDVIGIQLGKETRYADNVWRPRAIAGHKRLTGVAITDLRKGDLVEWGTGDKTRIGSVKVEGKQWMIYDMDNRAVTGGTLGDGGYAPVVHRPGRHISIFGL